MRVGSYAFMLFVFIVMPLINENLSGGVYFLTSVLVAVIYLFSQRLFGAMFSPIGQCDPKGWVFVESDLAFQLPADWPLCDGLLPGEEILLAPRCARQIGLVLLFLCAIVVVCILVLALIDSGYTPVFVVPVLILFCLDVFTSWIWYCSDSADSLARCSASMGGFRVRFGIRNRVEVVRWQHVDLHVYRVGFSLARVTFVCPFGIKTFMLHVDDVSNIMNMMGHGFGCKDGNSFPSFMTNTMSR